MSEQVKEEGEFKVKSAKILKPKNLGDNVDQVTKVDLSKPPKQKEDI